MNSMAGVKKYPGAVENILTFSNPYYYALRVKMRISKTIPVFNNPFREDSIHYGNIVP